MSLLLIKVEGSKRTTALIEDGKLVEYHQSADAGEIKADEIYLGRVGRVMKNLQAAFIRIADQKDGFLPFDQIPEGVSPKSGDSLLVQIKKPPLGDKAALVTAKISLAGSGFLFLPTEPGSKVSKRVKNETIRKALYRLADELLPEGFGILMQEDSLSIDKDALKDEITALRTQWMKLLEEAKHRSAPALLKGEPDLVLGLLRRLPSPPNKILCNQPDVLPDYGIPLSLAADPMQLYEVEHKLRRALRRRQTLKSGATLVIDPCEAMTVIDVNTAQNTAGKDRDRTLLKTNMEAVQEIARLMRLRKMGGIILIDLIDMKSSLERDEVIVALREALRNDPVSTAIHGFTSLGLLELTRRRADAPLSSETLLPCPRCKGSGMIHKEEEAHEA